ncbi:MAG: hypothetical protein A2487_15190 [Candidatus Raymondbacteria bacterium RifOxyC12_full_50_8]|uniref:Amidohydrolase-related domain-containing protein n=1 Tax=Candidatus Raymondbacteria bacterium RIFOXYD12_FULL_49_13 TaxID=1817890 RepID=A0A1F7FK81_UNCRA|nr:MAG: hypothetical protein A2350_10580 [Candidatus Raymondbacteria bacterium RifOxyB12_full_50_8]OGJ91982.1 MAG: hypothetical protein A2248_09410 [Candidatus Raymondbacteria bacterium RIFOXYA2_FULL_49_16]OGJ96350.1 MAG: hypothetical protein A2453_08480 [Candidatus Raymondbacteria bacterium RIFOXYC2_FULL_50_21]OGK03715.1 MAG: hypothetical protein A2487_15190 [Candidatus Raymondbacteria bacterium RifOxyC12_full_50_8]OGK06887.1 MAG: hypothetical protein A2519_11550 [Candidatus Raymondbacteria ba
MKSFAITLFTSIAVFIAGFIIVNQIYVKKKYEISIVPNLDTTVAERDTMDKGFSKGWCYCHRSHPERWFDIHTHILKLKQVDQKGVPLDMVKCAEQAFTSWQNQFKEFDIVGSVVLDGSPERMYLFDAAEKTKGMMVFAWVGYDKPDAQLLEKLVKEHGCKGVKMISRPAFNAGVDYRVYDSEKWHELYAKAGELGIPVLWHVVQRTGAAPYAYGEDTRSTWTKLNYTNWDVLKMFEGILEKHPNTIFIGAHQMFMGAKELDRLMKKYPNFFVDTSAGWRLKWGDHLTNKEILELRPFFEEHADRILFGTDFVYNIREKENVPFWSLLSMYSFQNFLIQLNLTQRSLDKIAWQNAYALLKIEKPDILD